MNTFRKRLLNHERMIGVGVSFCDPVITEMFALAGYDFIWIDTEHSAMDYQTALTQIMAARSGGSSSMVRIPWNEPHLAKRILEMGPDGIVFPMINSYEDAKKAIDSCIYPPDGKRGLGPIRAVRYGLDTINSYIKNYSDITCRFLQIEHIGAIRDLDRILEIPFLDGLVIGPYDLSGSIGRLGDVYGKECIGLIDTAISKCRRKGKPIGIAGTGDTDDDCRFWFDKGIQFIMSGGDMNFLSEGAKKNFARLKSVVREYEQK